MAFDVDDYNNRRRTYNASYSTVHTKPVRYNHETQDVLCS